MKCPKCQREDMKSKVYESQASYSTCMAWSGGHYNEDGEFISRPDPNSYFSAFNCSNGHHFQVVRKEGETDKIIENE